MRETKLESMELDDLEYTMLVDQTSNILVVDDEDVIRLVFDAMLADASYKVGFATSGEEAMGLAERDDYNLFIVDKNLPGVSGLELVRRVRERKPESEFIVITGYASYESAIEALRLGAFDYLEKPFDDLDLVREKITRALDRQRLTHENVVLADQLRSVHKDLKHKLAEARRDPAAAAAIETLRARMAQAAQSLQEAHTRLQALGQNRLIPPAPAAHILALLGQAWQLLTQPEQGQPAPRPN
ncbi:MAG TPA: response regulator [Myxococcota bacterium]|nr:response regulator [Myxococcota bacterium]HRY94353.1 response regulator [Myxococcota bacterium]HSA22853.1 response regulator [Myxococcota bacterium]